MRSKGTKLIAENRKARHEYFVLESYEAGIELAYPSQSIYLKKD